MKLLKKVFCFFEKIFKNINDIFEEIDKEYKQRTEEIMKKMNEAKTKEEKESAEYELLLHSQTRSNFFNDF